MDWIEIAMLGIGVAALVVEVVGMVGLRRHAAWGGTISETMRDNGSLWLSWPWLFGVMLGHWFCPWSAPDGWWVVMAGGTLGVVGSDVIQRVRGRRYPWFLPGLVAVVGVAVGALTWGMGYQHG